MKNVWITLYEINLVLCFSLDKYPFVPQFNSDCPFKFTLTKGKQKIFLLHGHQSGATDPHGIDPLFWSISGFLSNYIACLYTLGLWTPQSSVLYPGVVLVLNPRWS